MDETLERLRRARDEDPLDLEALERWQRERERQGWRHRGRTVDEWAERLGRPSRDAVPRQLARIGLGATPALCRALAHNDTAAVQGALQALDHIRSNEGDRARRLALPACLRALAAAPEEPLRTQIARMAARSGSAVLPELTGFAKKHPLPALTILRLLGPDAAPMRPFIEEALEHDDEAFILSAVLSLAVIGPGPAAEDRLRVLLQHRNYFVQRNAVQALSLLTNRRPATRRALLALLDTDYAELLTTVVLALAQSPEADGGAAAAIAEAAEGWGSTIQAVCLAAMLKLEDQPEALPYRERYAALRQGHDQLHLLLKYLRQLGVTRGGDHPLVTLLQNELETCADTIDRGLIGQALDLLSAKPVES